LFLLISIKYMKQVLIIGYVWPEPNSSAAGSRMMQLIQFFQTQQYQITFSSPAQTSDHMADLDQIGVKIQAINLNCSSFDQFVHVMQPDVVLFDRFMMEEQFGWRIAQHCPKALRLLDTEDLHCLRLARHNAFKQGREMLPQDLLNDISKREVASIFRCDLTLMISAVEMDILQTRFKVDACLLHYCPFMFEQPVLMQVSPIYQQRQHFISIGNFRHAPNWDAVLWLKQQIWPLIRAALPDAQLHIYGAYPPPKASALNDESSGFLVKGWVDDANAAMQGARVCLAPLRFGAGIKGKLAQAMLCSTPSVTTDIGAESMQTERPWGGQIAQDAKAIAQAAVTLYQDQQQWQIASDNGLKNGRSLYAQAPHFSRLARQLQLLLPQLESHRMNNVIGAMLNHHHHKSTQYMSQWIETKNKLAQITSV
jgi:glycosyltransferase involved in cell wall biosynthesis